MKLIKYLKPYWWLALLSPLFMIGETIANLFQPKLMSSIVDDGVLQMNTDVIWSTGIEMLLIVIVGGILGICASIFGTTAAQNFGNDLRNDVFNKVMHLSAQQTDLFTTGSLVTRLTNDVTMVQMLVSMTLRMFAQAPISFIGGIIMMMSLNVDFGLVLVCALPVQVIAVFVLLKKARPLFSVVQQKLDKVNAVVQENVSGARVVKAYVREEYESGRFGDANTDLMKTNLKVQRLMATMAPILMIVMDASVVAVILIGGFQIEAQNMNIGEVMAAITYISQILTSLMMVSMMFQMISRAMASATRINEVLSTVPVIVDGTVTRDSETHDEKRMGSVEFRNVSFHYPGYSGRPVLSHIDLTVHPGEMVAILGATGSGKSSLVNLIPRFYDPVEGEVLVDGVPVKDYELKTLRTKISFVLQKSELFSGTIADNIRWGKPDATDEEVEQAAQIAQADEFVETFKDRYHTQVDEKGTSLSGGQKQRVSIARAIIRNPEILIFDDSTSALDLGTEARLQNALREHLSDTTVIMIAQRVQSILHADRIFVLDQGGIAASGTHEELLKTSEIYRDIYHSQVREGEKENG